MQEMALIGRDLPEVVTAWHPLGAACLSVARFLIIQMFVYFVFFRRGRDKHVFGFCIGFVFLWFFVLENIKRENQ